jgi:hypothetical protein
MDDFQISRPSNMTIEAFVNSPSQLNVPSISNVGDISYVVYQKTGFTGSNPTQYAGFNTGTRQSQTYSAGKSTKLQFNKWYNVDDYYSASASTDGAPARLGTLTLKFKTPSGQILNYTYTATGRGDDTYLGWDPNNVVSSEGYPIAKTDRKIEPRPYKTTPGTQFLFQVSGSPFSSSIEAFLKKTSNTPQVTPSTTTQDLVSKFSPTFIIWRLNYIDTQYYVESGFPKFSKGFTSDTGVINPSWNDPRNWTKYESWT